MPTKISQIDAQGPIRELKYRKALYLCILSWLMTMTLISGCGGGSRGTGSYGLDGMRPTSISEDAKRAPREAPPHPTAEATPTPKQKR